MKTGVTIAVFHSLGKAPLTNEAENSNIKGKVMLLARCFKSSGGRPSGPLLDFGFSVLMDSIIREMNIIKSQV